MKNIKLIIILLSLPFITNAQNISFLAEIGHFQKAHSFSLNETGYFFVLDKGGNEIIKLDSSGTAVKKIGGTGWDDYTFDNPVDICVTMLRIYVTDKNNNRVQVYDKDLNFLFSLNPGNFSPDAGAFKYPVSAQASVFGDLFVIDSDNRQIIKFKPDWTFSNRFGNNESGKYAIANPIKIVVDNNSNLYLLDGNKILIYDQFGNGVSSFTLTEKPTNINLINNTLILIFNKHITYCPVDEILRDGIKLKKINFDLDKEIIDALITGNRIFLLTENSISIFNRRLIENSN